jgi:rod shape-determining protein MreD
MDRVPGIRPRPSLWRRLDAAARSAFPATTTLLLMLLTAAPFGLPDQGVLLPVVGLACVFFWSLFRPASMPPPVVFLLGLFADLLGYAHLGVNVLILLIVHGLALSWRRVLVRQGIMIVWLAFTAVAAGAAALGWLFACVLSFRLLPVDAPLLQALLAAGLYPLLATLFIRAHRGLADPGRA